MKQFNKPNLNAPRFRAKKEIILTKELYKEFLEKHSEYKNLSYEAFKEIILTYNKNLYEGVIENRNGVMLPEGLGYLFIGTCPPGKKKNIDFEKSTKYGVIASHKNWDSDNNLMKIFLTNSKLRYHIPNRQLWAFDAVREFKRSASQAYKEEWAKYVKVDSFRKIASLFKQTRKKQFLSRNKESAPKGYDEFKM